MKDFLTYKDALRVSGYIQASVTGPSYVVSLAGQRVKFIKETFLLQLTVGITGWVEPSQQEEMCEAIVYCRVPSHGTTGIDVTGSTYTEQNPSIVLHDGNTQHLPIMSFAASGEDVLISGLVRFSTTAGFRSCGVYWTLLYTLTS